MLFGLRLRYSQCIAETVRIKLFRQFTRALRHINAALRNGQPLLHAAKRYIIRRQFRQQRNQNGATVFNGLFNQPLALFHLTGNMPEQVNFPARTRTIG
ncbi:hypothetical protein GLF_2390 [Gluconobacter frateurii NBRC 101659]|nr:hypothetical protein GLF_2390 [Gluconobacter frateurii NBRC 101659]